MTIIGAIYRFYREFGVWLTITKFFEVLFSYIFEAFVIMGGRSRRLRKIIFALCVDYNDRSEIENFFHQPTAQSMSPKIGILLVGGMGDSLFLSAMAAGVLKTYPDARLYGFVRNLSHSSLFAGSALFAGVFGVRTKRLNLLRRIMQRELDTFYENRYVVRTKSRMASEDDLAATESRFSALNRNWTAFPLGNYLYGETGKTLYELASYTSGLTIDSENLSIPLMPEDLLIFSSLNPDGVEPYRYMTIHHGCDKGMVLADGTSSLRQTKNWYRERWEEVAACLEQKGYRIVQLGLDGEERIPGTLDLRGKLTIKQTASLLKYAAFHLDTEGGLVHLAQAVKTKSIVIFGPTPVSLFGYSGNINITRGSCHNCFWRDVRWFQRCPKGYASPHCMDAVVPEDVTSAANGLIAVSGRKTLPHADLVDCSRIPDSLAEHEGVLLQVYQSANIPFKGYRRDSFNPETGCHIMPATSLSYPYIIHQLEKTEMSDARLLMVGAGRDALQIYLSALGCKVSAADLTYEDNVPVGAGERHRFLKRYGALIEFRFASSLNLPFCDNTFDAVIAGPLTGDRNVLSYSLYEMLRVLRQSGKLILTCDLFLLSRFEGEGVEKGVYMEDLSWCLAKLGISIDAGQDPLCQLKGKRGSASLAEASRWGMVLKKGKFPGV